MIHKKLLSPTTKDLLRTIICASAAYDSRTIRLEFNHLIIIHILCCQAQGMPGCPPPHCMRISAWMTTSNVTVCTDEFLLGGEGSFLGFHYGVFCHLASPRLHGGRQLCCRAERPYSVLYPIFVNCLYLCWEKW